MALRDRLQLIPPAEEFLVPDIVQHARRALRDFGIPDPTGGWDDYLPGAED